MSFVTPESEAHFRLIEKRQRLQLPRERIAGFEPDPAPDAPSDGPTAAVQGTGGVKGKRPSKKDKLRAAAAAAATAAASGPPPAEGA